MTQHQPKLGYGAGAPGPARPSPQAGPYGAVWACGCPGPSPAGPDGDVCVGGGGLCPLWPGPTEAWGGVGGPRCPEPHGGAGWEVPAAPAGPHGRTAPTLPGPMGGAGGHIYEGKPPPAAAPIPAARASANHSPNSANGQACTANPMQSTSPSLIRRQSPRSVEAPLCPPLSRATNQ